MEKAKGHVSIVDNFSDRQKLLNDQLCIIEKTLNKHNNHQNSRVPELGDLSSSSKRNKIRGFRGRQSIFKRPEAPAPRSNIRTIPDYRVNPKKWTHYCLDDTPEMSNESNTAAAFSFLKEIEERKRRGFNKRAIRNRSAEVEEMDVVMGCSTEDKDTDNTQQFNLNVHSKNVHTFKSMQKKVSCQTRSKPKYENNKVVMPEYEMGSKKILTKKPIKKNFTDRINHKNEIKLDHLDDCSEEDS